MKFIGKIDKMYDNLVNWRQFATETTAERKWIKGCKAKEGSTLNKLLNKREDPIPLPFPLTNAIVEQTRGGCANPRYLSACV